jgi:hypothetical protein
MKARSFIVAGIGLGLLAATLLRAAPGAVPSKLLQNKVAAARKTFEVIWRNNREGLVPFAELAYRWSKRWLEAELEIRDQKADRLAAYQAHRERMLELARITRERYRNRVNTIEETTATDFYCAEAEIWVEQAKAK